MKYFYRCRFSMKNDVDLNKKKKKKKKIFFFFKLDV